MMSEKKTMAIHVQAVNFLMTWQIATTALISWMCLAIEILTAQRCLAIENLRHLLLGCLAINFF